MSAKPTRASLSSASVTSACRWRWSSANSCPPSATTSTRDVSKTCAAAWIATLEISAEELAAANQLTLSDDTRDLAECDVYIITVPTPIDGSKQPDLSPLRRASALVGSVLRDDNVVIYESTVYPGATEEVCVPILEKVSAAYLQQTFLRRLQSGARSTPATNSAA